MKKRRKIKWGRVLFLILFFIIIIGGFIMIKKQDNLKENSEVQNQEENNLKEVNSEQNTNESNDPQKTAPSNYQEFQNLSDGEYITEKGFTLVIKDGVASIDGNLIVNKTYSVPADYQPEDPYQEVTSERCQNCLNKEVMEAFQLMKSDATSMGLSIYIASGYRSYQYQNTLYNNYSAVSGTDGADTYSARAGHSEHQTGLCFDLNSVELSFADTSEGKWIQNQAYLYGFIIRYPKGKESITGYQYEPWHLRYVGKDLASKLYNDGDWITLEEYYGISSSY